MEQPQWGSGSRIGLRQRDVLATVRDYYPDLTTEDISACVRYAAEVLAAEDLHVSVTHD